MYRSQESYSAISKRIWRPFHGLRKNVSVPEFRATEAVRQGRLALMIVVLDKNRFD